MDLGLTIDHVSLLNTPGKAYSISELENVNVTLRYKNMDHALALLVNAWVACHQFLNHNTKIIKIDCSHAANGSMYLFVVDNSNPFKALLLNKISGY